MPFESMCRRPIAYGWFLHLQIIIFTQFPRLRLTESCSPHAGKLTSASQEADEYTLSLRALSESIKEASDVCARGAHKVEGAEGEGTSAEDHHPTVGISGRRIVVDA